MFFVQPQPHTIQIARPFNHSSITLTVKLLSDTHRLLLCFIPRFLGARSGSDQIVKRRTSRSHRGQLSVHRLRHRFSQLLPLRQGRIVGHAQRLGGIDRPILRSVCPRDPQTGRGLDETLLTGLTFGCKRRFPLCSTHRLGMQNHRVSRRTLTFQPLNAAGDRRHQLLLLGLKHHLPLSVLDQQICACHAPLIARRLIIVIIDFHDHIVIQNRTAHPTIVINPVVGLTPVGHNHRAASERTGKQKSSVRRIFGDINVGGSRVSSSIKTEEIRRRRIRSGHLGQANLEAPKARFQAGLAQTAGQNPMFDDFNHIHRVFGQKRPRIVRERCHLSRGVGLQCRRGLVRALPGLVPASFRTR
ncbi:hypothetical protein [Vibrio coralliilyticus]|uniref:hypothetical protein n=1 Tax=Vibrio coralliilyticus TaxID=190893 RepID=UPI0020B873F8|nr:hypothetical protein [Vibrio coralliilyticus]